MYWGLNCVGKNLVFPVKREKKLPVWLNFVTHTNVALVPLADIVISKHDYPNRWACVFALLVALANYLGVILLVNFKTGKWIYGFLGKCDSMQRIFILAGCAVIAVLFFLFGEMCNKSVKKQQMIKEKKTE